MSAPPPPERRPFAWRGAGGEAVRIRELLRTDALGGMLVVAAASLGILWANSPWADAYTALRDLEVGYAPWHLRLSLGTWAADGLLAIFFFVVGLELKRELVVGDLRRFGTAIVPVVAAAGGVAVPALLYASVVSPQPELLRGWAIPTATDIAFAVAVLALVGSRLPSALRVFLLTLAVVDDLIAIAIIAVWYTDGIELVPLLLGLAAIAVYAVLSQRCRLAFRLRPAAAWLILLPVGVVAWAFVHASGIHATIAGVLLGFTIPVRHRRRDAIPDAEPGLAEVFEHRFRPLSAGFAVPVFAFFSAGVSFGGLEGLGSALTDPVTLGIVVGLVVGKPVGIVVTTWLVTRARGIRLDPSLTWFDLVGVGVLAGIGFTVSLLVTELSFAPGDPHRDHAKTAILLASVAAAVAASVLLTIRNRHHRRLDESTRPR
ncbi:Na+/H+ antiporter NhaA [Microbacterium sp.]|uniref:Na+/H+ antiporter NhaA n=1 Tax=Microbacterium sp. TaxID=51671 RepID=UPI0039E2F24F